MQLIERNWTRVSLIYLPIKDYAHTIAEDYYYQLNSWKSDTDLEGELRSDIELGWAQVANYASEIAVNRVCRALGVGTVLRSYVEGSRKDCPYEISSDFWKDPHTGALNVEPILSGVVTSAPFGGDDRNDIPPLAEGKAIFLRQDKALRWREKHNPKLERLFVPKFILAAWYGQLDPDASDRRSLVWLRERANRELRMRVSEAQIDELVKLEGRRRGRPSGS